jgi:hypothetical protein
LLFIQADAEHTSAIVSGHLVASGLLTETKYTVNTVEDLNGGRLKQIAAPERQQQGII